jgi:hypothetical protein
MLIINSGLTASYFGLLNFILKNTKFFVHNLPVGKSLKVNRKRLKDNSLQMTHLQAIELHQLAIGCC